ncbi:type IV toxin-antitoxin system AbiEi family antitoxin domain-containing protein [Paenibacillus sp. 2TAB19]|uniref:type IV toxin-antitoxin system AbiEi family antitoxin domain-containing protein n=1 Tax=Paenibacillus sp. 2TAB19 TaxID=3233003 RepID=UPI003F95870A
MELFKQEINDALSDCNKPILTDVDISTTFFLYKDSWKLPQSTKVHDFFGFLVKKNIIKEVGIQSPKGKISRYLLSSMNLNPNNLDPNLIAISLFPQAYISHYSAVSLHGLTDEIVKVVYVNKEQTKKTSIYSKEPQLLQENIDNAFASQMRETNNYYEYSGRRIYALNGRYTGRLGVDNQADGYAVTNLERTLIDIAVRPNYSGGVFEVIKIYEKAKGSLKSNRLSAYLKKLSYIYPYHQAIGFYLERAGYSDSVVKLMELPMNNRFYLTYGMKDMEFSERWNLYYPKNI